MKKVFLLAVVVSLLIFSVCLVYPSNDSQSPLNERLTDDFVDLSSATIAPVKNIHDIDKLNYHVLVDNKKHDNKEELSAVFDRALATQDSNEFWSRRDAIIDLFDSNQQFREQLMSRLVSSKSDLEVSLLLGVLGQSKTNAGQDSLLKIVTVKEPAVSTDLKVGAIIQLGLIDHPTPKTIEYLVESSSGDSIALHEVATLALGAASVRAGPSDSEVAIEHLKRVYIDSTNSGARLLALRALGNAGDAAGGNFVSGLLTDESESIRAGAVDALRHHSGLYVNDLILDVARNDHSINVRATAIETLKYRPMDNSIFHALGDLALNDQDADIKITSLNAMFLIGYDNQFLLDTASILMYEEPDSQLGTLAKQIVDASL